MSEWISVKERLPETIRCNAGTEYSEAVVVLTENRKICTAIWNGRMWIGDFGFWEAWDDEITHWMSVLPLQEPPEEDDEHAGL